MADPRFTLTIDLNALNHLGINLYSNIPAVVSEVVANAWDADAENVWIDIDTKAKTVTITDDGSGMDVKDVNAKYLKVGYSKRANGITITRRHHRHVMGRKGIGKLSLFSIANTIEVQTAKTDENGKLIEKNGFIMRARDIQERIEGQGGDGDYHPEVIPKAKIKIRRGTRIVLKDLKSRGALSAGFIRTRLARRFSVIGPEHSFQVFVDKKAITIEDRAYFKSIEFVWYFGDESQTYADLCTKARKREKLSNIVNRESDYTVSGWIGTFDERRNIEDGNNSIVVHAWGKLVQEDLLKELDEGGLFTKYLIGEIRADFIDSDDLPDIATSDRQRLREDDPRYKALRQFVQTAVKKHVKLSWTKWRTEAAEERARENTAVDEWFKSLGPDNRRYARELFGRIEALAIPDKEAKKELYKQSILAFESLALKKNLQALEGIDSVEELDRLAQIMGSMDEIEASHYYQIVKGRIDVLTKLDRVKGKALEKVVQEHIFDHLWLLDPSWERASTDQGMEVIVGKAFGKITAKLTPEERKARLDIKYRTAAGKNIVIELKKYDRTVKASALAQQIEKYRGALQKILAEQFPEQPQQMEFICLVGNRPTGNDPKTVDAILRAVDARYITYDDLLKATRDSYRDYLDSAKKIARIEKLIDSL